MTGVKVIIGSDVFEARFEEDKAPATIAAVKAVLPWKQMIRHVRWSGEACWIPLGDFDFGIGFENATSYPSPGQFILYPGGVSETEILVAYGPTCFASKAGQLAGNHFMTITEGLDRLAELGRQTLITGQIEILIKA